MNAYAVVILIALIAEFVLDGVSQILTMRRWRGRLPLEFRGWIDPKTARRSRQYARTLTRFGLAISSFELALLLVFWLSGGFNALDRIVREWGLPPVLTGLAFIAILMLLHFILVLPFDWYATFGIEARFGFNRTSRSTFVKDILKTLALFTVIGGPLLAGLLAFFQVAGPRGWLAAWGGVAVFMLLAHFAVPAWILPLFNRFTPLEDGRRKKAVIRYARYVSYPLAGVFVMDGSRRTTKSNAFLAGFGKRRRVALYDTLIKSLSASELVTVLAHEIGHHKMKHVSIGLGLGVLHAGFLLFLLSQFLSRPGLFKAFFMEHMSVYAGMLFFGLLASPLEFVFSIGSHALSRQNEFQADSFAVRTTRKSEAFITALKKLSVQHLINLRPHPFDVFLHFAHPPVLERIRRIRRLRPVKSEIAFRTKKEAA